MKMHDIKPIVVMILCCCLLSSCSITQDLWVADTVNNSDAKPRATIADIKLTAQPMVKTVLPTPNVNQLIADYRSLIKLSTDAQMKAQISHRLAQLLLINNEQAQEVGTSLPADANGYYDKAISAYQTLLKTSPAGEQREQLLYQLAKAYELQGEAQLSFNTIVQLTEQFPDTEYAQELYFRRGEYLFSQQKFSDAARAYHQVIQRAQTSPYYITSLYMLAWSQFKLDNQDSALIHFTQLLDLSLPATATLDIDVEKLPLSTRKMVKDTLHVMGLIFTLRDGALTLAQHFEQVGHRYYEYLNYQQLAKSYLASKRYRDSAVTYGDFVTRYPDHEKSPFFAINKIETYQLGRFPSSVSTEKRQFVKTYGINGAYWRNWSTAYKARLADSLKAYLVEFSQDSYRIAQQETNKIHQKALFAAAARWFLEYQQTFNDSHEMAFLYAESLYASDQFSLAITSFEAFAYQKHIAKSQAFPVNSSGDESLIAVVKRVVQQGTKINYQSVEKRADAAYAALLAHEKVIAIGTNSEKIKQQESSAQQFVDTFEHDKRRLSVLLQLMNQRFVTQRYSDALSSARQLLKIKHILSHKQQLDANLIVAHSIFNLARYEEAATNYGAVMRMLDTSDKRLIEIKENYAASLFKQSEDHISRQELAKAVRLLVTIIEKTPDTSIRKLAQFNAAQYLYQLKEFKQAGGYLADFRQRFKDDVLGENISTQMISIYVEQEDWRSAAKEYLQTANAMKDTSAQQAPLFMAASYFDKAGEMELARVNYRRYAHSNNPPFDQLIEVYLKLSNIYKEQGEDAKRRYWLNKIIKKNDEAKTATTQRATYLAAMSAMVFASDAHFVFNKVKLTLPLRNSLKRKQSSLTKVLAAYQKSASYNVAQFATESTFKSAQVFRQMAEDLMSSTRPKGLDALALEQYEILLEEQAFPFEDKAISVFENNARRSWQGIFDVWVKKSFASLAVLLPGRYNKEETIEEQPNIIY